MRRLFFLVITVVLFFSLSSKVKANICTTDNNLCIECETGLLSGGSSCPVPNMPLAPSENKGWCRQCVGYNPATERYEYDVQTSKKMAGVCQSGTSTVAVDSPISLNTNVNGCWWHGGIPAGCDQDFTCEAGGQGGECGEEGEGPQCPGGYQGDDCSNIPCGWRNECGCQCACDSQCELQGGQCQDAGGGGGPSPTPTPTPTPYCTLSCPSAGTSGGGDEGDTGGGNSGIGGSEGSSSLRASGDLTYNGYNGFLCDLFDNGWVGDLICPSGGGGGGGSSGGSESWTRPVTYNMLCGEQETVYTASVDGSSSNGGDAGPGGGGHGGGPPPTVGPTPTYGLYPPGCSIGGGPSATPDPGGGDTGGGGIGSEGAGALSCSCISTLSCPLTLQSPPSDPANESGECVPSVCDFSVNPSYPIFSNEVTFDLDIQEALIERTIDFEDNAGIHSLSSSASQTTNTFVNAGAYKVTLTCSNGSGAALSCSRLVNVYCNNGVAPSPSPTPGATNSWFKVKDTSFIREEMINNTIPSNAAAYDSDDTGICSLTDSGDRACMLSGVAGTALSEGAISVGDGTTSAVGWQKADTTIIKRFSPSTFLAYVKARKFLTTITNISDISGKKIYIHIGNLTLSNADVTSVTGDFVLIVQGDLTITENLTDLEDQSVAFIATGGLNIEEAVDELHGIYSATTIDFASDVSLTSTPLKIVGNIISKDPSDLTKRVRADETQPSLFVILDIRPYLDLLPLLSVRNTEQEELAQ